MKYVYNDKGQFIFSTFDEVDNADIEKMYNNAIIIAEKLKAPKLENGVLIETVDKYITVIFDNKTKQILEVKNGYFELDNSKVFDFNSDVLENKKYYFINDSLELIFNSELKQSDEEKDKQEKLEKIKKGIEYKNRIDTLEQKIKDLTQMILENFEGGEE